MSKKITKKLSVGKHTIRVTCAGFDNYEATIEVFNDGTVDCVRVIGGSCSTSARPGIFATDDVVVVYMKVAKKTSEKCSTTADFTYSISGRTVSFTNRSRTSSGCSIREVYWVFNNDDEEFIDNPRYTFPAYDRSYPVKLRVEDSSGRTYARTRNIRTGSSAAAKSSATTKSISFTIPDGATLTVLN